MHGVVCADRFVVLYLSHDRSEKLQLSVRLKA